MNSEQSAALLQQLRDIHGAPAQPWWPPAPGWWLLALMLLVLLLLVCRAAWHGLRRRQRRQARLRALVALRQQHDPGQQPQAWLAAVNRLLKVVVLEQDLQPQARTYSGTDWAAFLEDPEFSILATGPWEPAPLYDADRLEAAAKRWLQRHG